MNKYRTIKYKPTYQAHIETSNVVLRESTPIDVFYAQKIKPKHCENEAIVHVDPIIMLFNQERLKRTLGIDSVESWIQSLSANKSNPLSELRAKLSDQELAQLVKSRHIQNPSELWKYAQYMESEMDNFKSEVKQIVESEKLKESASAATNVDPNQSVSSSE